MDTDGQAYGTGGPGPRPGLGPGQGKGDCLDNTESTWCFWPFEVQTICALDVLDVTHRDENVH